MFSSTCQVTSLYYHIQFYINFFWNLCKTKEHSSKTLCVLVRKDFLYTYIINSCNSFLFLFLTIILQYSYSPTTTTTTLLLHTYIFWVISTIFLRDYCLSVYVCIYDIFEHVYKIKLKYDILIQCAFYANYLKNAVFSYLF